MIPVIISGGSGSRLWPLSRQSHPKPYVRLPDNTTLIGKTFQRAASIADVTEIYIVTNEEHYFLARDCFEEAAISGIKDNYLLEPVGKNTAAAIAAATLLIAKEHGENTELLILPADHTIDNIDVLNEAISEALNAAREGQIVTFGIKPAYPESGYGYIEVRDGKFSKFVEKPKKEIAQSYVDSGIHFWNSGMFCFTAGTMLTALKRHCPEVLEGVEASLEGVKDNSKEPSQIARLSRSHFSKIPDISIDYAVMEKADNITCITSEPGWSDIGSWIAFAQNFPIDADNNQINGEVVSENVSGCFVDAKTRVVGLVGVKDLLVVDTPDALLIANKNEAQSVKNIFNKLKEKGHSAAMLNSTVHRPWGTYTVLEEGDHYKIKRIEVKPGQRLSLQAHHHRSEHWVVVSGAAKVVNGDREIFLSSNESTYIPCGYKHRLENPGILPLVLIEVQSGAYLGEDDIIRFEDIYGRN